MDAFLKKADYLGKCSRPICVFITYLFLMAFLGNSHKDILQSSNPQTRKPSLMGLKVGREKKKKKKKRKTVPVK